MNSFDFRPLKISDERVDFILGDLRDRIAVDKAAEGCSVVFHLASIPSIARADYEDYASINVTGTRNVLQAAQRHRIKHAVYVSSSTVYGIPKKFPLKETDIQETVGNYGRSKLAAEKVCDEFTDIAVAIIRPRVVLGAGRIGIFSILFDAVLNNSRVYMIGSGNNIFQFTGVTDLVEAIISAMYTQFTSEPENPSDR